MVLAACLGVMIGLVLGLTGAGGGILAVPALVLGLGFPMETAAPVALIAVGMAALIGALDGLRRGAVRYKAALLMAGVGSVISPLGFYLAGLLPQAALLVLFSAVMILVAVRMLRQSIAQSGKTPDTTATKPCMLSASTGKFIWTPRSGATLGSIGAVSGLFTGMLGVGGGFIIVPALKHFSNVSMYGIVSTSLMVITLISAVTVTNALLQGVTLSGLAWVFIGFTMAGMVGGRLLAPLLAANRLQSGFAIISLCVALLLLARALGAV